MFLLLHHVASRILPGCLVLAVCLCPISSARAQYIYLDTNGDGRCTQADTLNRIGMPTTVSVCLDTRQNADMSAMYGGTGGDSLTISSYEFILHANGGTVAFSDYENMQPTMTTPSSSAVASSATDFYVGYGGETMLPPGNYILGTIVVTVTSGSPGLIPVGMTKSGGLYQTSFGSSRPGLDRDHLLKLDRDWDSAAGCGPPGGNAPPMAEVPQEVDVRIGEPVAIIGEFYDPNSGDSLTLDVSGLPPGLFAVRGRAYEQKEQVRIYGALRDAAARSGTYDLVWSASDGIATRTVHTKLRVKRFSSDPQTEEYHILELIKPRYIHGMPNLKARALGTAALPILARLLRDVRYKRDWHKITQAIGTIGDTSYFDTLRAFIWDRFRGPIDEATHMAIRTAQGALAPMATISARAMDYLIATSMPAAWTSVPWNPTGPPPPYEADLMARETLITLAYTDSDQADGRINAVPMPEGRDLRRVHARVRKQGLLFIWEDNERSIR